MHTAGP